MQPGVNLFALQATEVSALIKSGDITVEEYARSLLDRIKDRDDVIKAWTYLGASFADRMSFKNTQ
jgi:amidase